jgi:lipid II:glycine glycyltransferase (peptidoglycan interpeptide bridge formation enzyme)
MFEINHRVKFGVIRLKDVYYAPSINFSEKGYDVVYYFNTKENHGRSKLKRTLHIDLTMDQEELFSSFSYHTRKSIRLMMDDDNLSISIIENPTSEEIDHFVNFYNQFAIKSRFVPARGPYLINYIRPAPSR